MKRHALMLLVLAVAAASCGKDHGSQPAPFDFDYPPTPVDVTATAGVEQATISWSYPAGSRDLIEEFRLYYYVEVYDAVQLIATLTDTFYVDSRLVGNLEYCYKVSAVDTNGIEGWRSDPACALVDTH